MRKEFKFVYKDPETSYSALDFLGSGKISMHAFTSNLAIKRLKIDEEDLKHWLIRDRIFPDENTDIDFQHFKTKFYPDFYLIEDVNEFALNDLKKENQILFAAKEGTMDQS